MSAHVLLNLLNEFGKKCESCRAFYYFFATSLINSIIQEHECSILYHMKLKLVKNHIFGLETSRFCHLLCNIIMDVIKFPDNL